jgi:hypothetical protein
MGAGAIVVNPFRRPIRGGKFISHVTGGRDISLSCRRLISMIPPGLAGVMANLKASLSLRAPNHKKNRRRNLTSPFGDGINDLSQDR